MTKKQHKIYQFTLTIIVLFVLFYLMFYGSSYYITDLKNRFFHEQNDLLKPSGLYGHGMGIIGSTAMIIGIFGYMARKRMRIFMRWGVLKYWLEFHIFLCSLGPILVLYHTAFKFGGIVAISFWSMVAVVISGIIGRFIYIQIPRTIEGRELGLNELKKMKSNIGAELQSLSELSPIVIQKIEEKIKFKTRIQIRSFVATIYQRLMREKRILKEIKDLLKSQDINRRSRKKIVKHYRAEIILARRIEWLSSMQNLLRYWHVMHLPFALIMLIIMLVHIIVAILFGYKWIF